MESYSFFTLEKYKRYSNNLSSMCESLLKLIERFNLIDNQLMVDRIYCQDTVMPLVSSLLRTSHK